MISELERVLFTAQILMIGKPIIRIIWSPATITYLLQTRFTYEIKLNEHISLTPNLNVTHSSNGAQRAPNRGINIITANMGMSYKIKSQEEKEIRDI